MSGQKTFSFSAGKVILQSSDGSKRQLSTEEQTFQAEIIRCLDVVDSNIPFIAVENDNYKYSKMFPSDIAKNYQQKKMQSKICNSI